MGSRKLVLASSSSRREKILTDLNLDFTIVPSKVNEEQFNGLEPENYVKKIANAKAVDVAELVEDTVIIAADTIIVYQNQIIGKPTDKKDAKKTLMKLQGDKHQVLTGIAILSTINNKVMIDYDKTDVYMRTITESEIDNYIKTGQPLDKAGSYGIQDLGGIFIEKIHGSYFTVVGLPIHKLALMLKDFSINIL